VWCNVTIYPVCDAQGHLINTVSVMIDVTHSRMPEILRNKMLEAMVREESIESLMALVCKEVQRIAPEVIASILSVDDDGLLRTLASPDLPESYSAALDAVAIGAGVGSCGAAAFSGQAVMVRDIASHPFWVGFRDLALPLGLRACWSTPIKSSSGRVLGTFAFYYRSPREPSLLHEQLVNASIYLCALALEREQSRAHIQQLAFYDDLTGLPNRNQLHVRANQAIADASRNGTPLTVLFIDLDRFKQVNDSLGHPAGDEFLRVIARRLTKYRRKVDIVSRLSGDEFVVVAPVRIEPGAGGDRVLERRTERSLPDFGRDAQTVGQYRCQPFSRRWPLHGNPAASRRHGHVSGQDKWAGLCQLLQSRPGPVGARAIEA
jgi:GGDEF domain-containing protein